MVVECEKEQSILADIRTYRADGLSYQRIANELTRQGVRTRTGREYSKQGIAQIYRAAAAIEDYLALAGKTKESYTCTDEKEVSE